MKLRGRLTCPRSTLRVSILAWIRGDRRDEQRRDGKSRTHYDAARAGEDAAHTPRSCALCTSRDSYCTVCCLQQRSAPSIEVCGLGLDDRPQSTRQVRFFPGHATRSWQTNLSSGVRSQAGSVVLMRDMTTNVFHCEVDLPQAIAPISAKWGRAAGCRV